MAKTYDPTDYIITIDNQPITEFAPGTFVKGGRIKELGSIKVGADGTPVIILSKDKSGQFTITLLPTSGSNDKLSALAARFEAQAVRGDGIVTFMIKDLNGRTVEHSETAFVSKYPDFEGADDLSNREWTIMCGSLAVVVGGANA